jgi:hypothetical protein
VARLAHDDEFPNTVSWGLCNAAGAKAMATEFVHLQSCSPGCTLEELADGIFVATGAPRRMPRPAMFQETVSCGLHGITGEAIDHALHIATEEYFHAGSQHRGKRFQQNPLPLV